jgi:hypothetical protein
MLRRGEHCLSRRPPDAGVRLLRHRAVAVPLGDEQPAVRRMPVSRDVPTQRPDQRRRRGHRPDSRPRPMLQLPVFSNGLHIVAPTLPDMWRRTGQPKHPPSEFGRLTIRNPQMQGLGWSNAASKGKRRRRQDADDGQSGLGPRSSPPGRAVDVTVAPRSHTPSDCLPACAVRRCPAMSSQPVRFTGDHAPGHHEPGAQIAAAPRSPPNHPSEQIATYRTTAPHTLPATARDQPIQDIQKNRYESPTLHTRSADNHGLRCRGTTRHPQDLRGTPKPTWRPTFSIGRPIFPKWTIGRYLTRKADKPRLRLRDRFGSR